MTSWWDLLATYGAQAESEVAATAEPMAPGSMSMIIGVYVGLVLGTMEPTSATRMRSELEAEMAEGMGVPGETLEAEMRQLLATVKARGGR